jgi:hypothetical protein
LTVQTCNGNTACESTANVSERGPTISFRCEGSVIGWHWPAMPEVERAMGIENIALILKIL